MVHIRTCSIFRKFRHNASEICVKAHGIFRTSSYGGRICYECAKSKTNCAAYPRGERNGS